MPIQQSFAFPKKVRILRRGDFRKVYDQGVRFSCPYFAAFCLSEAEQGHPHVGFTVSRASGNSVIRNRMKRRMREAVRLHLAELPPQWSVVFNPRKPVLTAHSVAIESQVVKLFSRCAGS